MTPLESSCEAPKSFIRDYAIREINTLLWVSLISITYFLLRKLTKLVQFWAKTINLPGPPCPSFFGHSNLFSSDNPSDYLAKAHVKYGSVVRLWMGPTQLMVSITDPKLIREVLVKAEDRLPFTGKAFRLAFGRSNLFVPEFEKAKKKRESLAVHLNEKLFRRSNEIPSKVVNFVMQRNGAVVGGALDCGLLAQQLAFSFHGSYLFGDTFLAWSNALLYEDLLMKISSEACIWASYSVPPIWKRRFWRYKHLCLKLKRLTQEIIQHFSQRDRDSHTEAMIIRRETPTKSEVSPSDWMVDDVLLGELDENLNLKEETCGDIMGLMFHGCLTTAGLISNILTRLVTHPEMQDKIHSEIIMVRQRSNESEMHDFRSMNFLLATIFESARLLPARPLLQRCSLKHDLHLDAGIIVPAGAILVVPVQLVQMDDSRWGGDAPQFNPRRFLSKAEEVVNLGEGPLMLKDPNTNASFLPFGSGARACVGQKYVIAGIARLFACLLQQYEIRVQAGSSPSEPKPTMNNCILHLLPSPNIILVKRNS